MKAYLAFHCLFQGGREKRIGLVFPVAVVRSRWQYSFGNFQWQIFFLQKCLPEYCLRCVAVVCWHTLSLRGQTSFHPVCPPCSIPNGSCWQSKGRQRRQFSFQCSSYSKEKTRLMLIERKAAFKGKFCPRLHHKRNDGAGFDRASGKSGSSELDRTVGSYFLPSFDGS